MHTDRTEDDELQRTISPILGTIQSIAPDPSATSEVGSARAQQENATEKLLRLLLETQNQSMMRLIKTIKKSSAEQKPLSLPEFDPIKPEMDPEAWSATADICLFENDLQGGDLVVVLSKALKGDASRWLSQVAFPGMTWPQFKNLFAARFISMETPAATLINIHNDHPKDNENLAAYTARLMTSLSAKWQNLTTEQMIVTTVLAHAARFDDKLQDIAFTTSITSREKLQRKLQTFSLLKRKTPSTASGASDAKRFRSTSGCFTCGRFGHRAAECRANIKPADKAFPTKFPAVSSSTGNRNSIAVTCYQCGNAGHYASRCPRVKESERISLPAVANRSSGVNPSPSSDVQRRVDLCVVTNPSGTLNNNGETFSFCYDSGAECSLISETMASKFSGKHIHNTVTMIGIGQSRVNSTMQILSEIKIGDLQLEVLFHVLPDKYLKSGIMIGREVLSHGHPN